MLPWTLRNEKKDSHFAWQVYSNNQTLQCARHNFTEPVLSEAIEESVLERNGRPFKFNRRSATIARASPHSCTTRKISCVRGSRYHRVLLKGISDRVTYLELGYRLPNEIWPRNYYARNASCWTTYSFFFFFSWQFSKSGSLARICVFQSKLGPSKELYAFISLCPLIF